MPLFLLLADDDASSAATLLLQMGPTVDELVGAVTDLGGQVHALVTTAGPYSVAGLVTLPDEKAAVALRLVHASRGRTLDMYAAVSVGDFAGVIDHARRITVTSPASGDPEGE